MFRILVFACSPASRQSLVRTRTVEPQPRASRAPRARRPGDWSRRRRLSAWEVATSDHQSPGEALSSPSTVVPPPIKSQMPKCAHDRSGVPAASHERRRSPLRDRRVSPTGRSLSGSPARQLLQVDHRGTRPVPSLIGPRCPADTVRSSTSTRHAGPTMPHGSLLQTDSDTGLRSRNATPLNTDAASRRCSTRQAHLSRRHSGLSLRSE
jgi:hypothetical protein